MPFSLDNLHNEESKHVHLCNNSIQKLAEVTPTTAFAQGCMWTSDELKEHLTEQVRF